MLKVYNYTILLYYTPLVLSTYDIPHSDLLTTNIHITYVGSIWILIDFEIGIFQSHSIIGLSAGCIMYLDNKPRTCFNVLINLPLIHPFSDFIFRILQPFFSKFCIFIGIKNLEFDQWDPINSL